MKNTSLKKQIYQKIFDKIIKNQYPRNRLLTETSLTDEFGASKAIIREALIELCKDDILQNIPRAGYQIVQLSVKEISDAIHTRVILEVSGAKEAIQKITERDIEQLEHLIQKENTAIEMKTTLMEEWWKTNMEFHLKIAQCSGNLLLTDMIKKTFGLLWRATAQYFYDKEPISYLDYYSGSHAAIVEAIKIKNEKMLVNLITKDILSLRKVYQVS